MERTNVTGLTLEEMYEFMKLIDQPGYRAEQLFNWIYKKRITSFNDMTNISKGLRSKLNEIAEIGLVKLIKINSSSDNQTKKFLFQLKDELCIESVFMIEGKRTTVCLSTDA